ncbi:MAG TPA: glycoside hydrolase family 2 TIM barrel-domain containing protein [Defluviitaleaceae bacterium]|jgi:beta-galactosidase/beta-glucuronidase|nr:glycoside hydrolase family 2 [Candidatus Epulonipiscium sp.]HOQ16870.1 glycoside hydrolase family 2 TIM barrel-domain containing protein [Defluviitaleaceae bacterium]HPT75969.1 glycoside hydrolase family 2 TIM barrel-domain containing protein [Defluviitaleaceae bacterium]HQD51143.1 glycoside hydrolase family 2 TIM barrel-domain containing protein [Defluviitaleaceae bacterium]
MNTHCVSHPRPDFLRQNWMILNGNWSFDFDDHDEGEVKEWFNLPYLKQKIEVPFVYQSEASGIEDKNFHPILWYQRTFKIPEDFKKSNIILHFGAVDYLAKVWLNGTFIGEHEGGYTPFHFDITPHVKRNEENNLVVKVIDHKDPCQPRGKQYWEEYNEMCWYQPSSGIWQSVWLENTGSTRMDYVKITPDLDNRLAIFEIFLEGEILENYEIKIALSHKNSLPPRKKYFYHDFVEKSTNEKDTPFQIVSYTLNSNPARIAISFKEKEYIKDIHYWSPENPHLIEAEISLYANDQLSDKVTTYFGMRKIELKGDEIYLNNQPYYQKLILDQGYWPDTHLTPPSDEAIKADIEYAKMMGFNGARKHQKIEDPRYYYWADILGFLVWGELPSAYDYNDKSIKNLSRDMHEFIRRDYNHPSIITWVPLNESWGVRNIYYDKSQQAFAASLYYQIKALDQTRLISNNDGWEIVNQTDIYGLHDYTAYSENLSENYESKEKLMTHHSQYRPSLALGHKYQNKPLLITEYGGIAFQDEADQSWGYFGKVKSKEEFLERFRNITLGFRKIPYIRGYCYTQLTDVYQEKNGLLTMDRKFKIEPELIKKIIEK